MAPASSDSAAFANLEAGISPENANEPEEVPVVEAASDRPLEDDVVEAAENAREKSPTTGRTLVFIEEAIVYSLLGFAGMVGLLIREGLIKLTTYPGSSYGGVLWANFTGCVIMGLLVHGYSLLLHLVHVPNSGSRRTYTAAAQIPLYVMITTGACGSITSMSSFIELLFELSANEVALNYRNPAYGIMTFLSYVIVTLAVSCGGLIVGKHMANAIDILAQSQSKVFFSGAHEFAAEVLFSILGIVGYIVVLVLAIARANSRFWTLRLLVAPFGVYGRFWASKYMNKWSPRFYWGTFFVNVFGTALLSMFVLLQRGSQTGQNLLINCQMLGALADGFCGNLTTISTFINELMALKRTRDSYIYGGVTVAMCFAMTVLILGSYVWTHGPLSTARC